MPNKAALDEILKAISEIATTNDNTLGPVEIYRPAPLRQRMDDEKAKLEEQNRERMDRLRGLRNSIVRS